MEGRGDAQPWRGLEGQPGASHSHHPPPWPPDCYSETEAEDPDDETPRHGCDSVSGPMGDPGEGMGDPHLTSRPVSSPAKEEAAKHPGESPALPGQWRAQQRSQ